MDPSKLNLQVELHIFRDKKAQNYISKAATTSQNIPEQNIQNSCRTFST